ncbi:MAG: hypothetical protein LWY06_06265 [Firmicutes bacterium]|nr:hypothetical protein [Bacillota bacterium]
MTKKRWIFIGIVLILFAYALTTGLRYTSEQGFKEGVAIPEKELNERKFVISNYSSDSKETDTFLCYLNPVCLSYRISNKSSYFGKNEYKDILPGFDIIELNRLVGIDAPPLLWSFAVNRTNKEGFYIADNLEKYGEAYWRAMRKKAVRNLSMF